MMLLCDKSDFLPLVNLELSWMILDGHLVNSASERCGVITYILVIRGKVTVDSSRDIKTSVTPLVVICFVSWIKNSLIFSKPNF
jgi:hypothetical protein